MSRQRKERKEGNESEENERVRNARKARIEREWGKEKGKKRREGEREGEIILVEVKLVSCRLCMEDWMFLTHTEKGLDKE